MSSRSIVAWSFVWVLGWTASAIAQTPPSDDDERARLHFTSGRSYFEEGNYEQALDEFNHAYELSHRDVLLVNIANCEERLGSWREEAAHLESYVTTLAADAADRGTLERRITALRQRADQHDQEEAARLAAAHGTETHPTEPGPAVPPPTRPASDGLLVPAIIAFSVGAAAGIAWGVLGGLALGEQSTIQSGCGATHSCTSAQVSNLNSFATGADVSMSIFLVAVAAGAVLLIVDPPHGASVDGTARLRLTPWGGTQGGGLALGGSF